MLLAFIFPLIVVDTNTTTESPKLKLSRDDIGQKIVLLPKQHLDLVALPPEAACVILHVYYLADGQCVESVKDDLIQKFGQATQVVT